MEDELWRSSKAFEQASVPGVADRTRGERADMIDPTVAHRLLQHPQIAELLVRAFGAKVQFVEEYFAGIHRVKDLDTPCQYRASHRAGEDWRAQEWQQATGVVSKEPLATKAKQVNKNLGNIETEEIINPPKQLPSPQRPLVHFSRTALHLLFYSTHTSEGQSSARSPTALVTFVMKSPNLICTVLSNLYFEIHTSAISLIVHHGQIVTMR
eukprot:1772116-Rhodomonas_salina.1